MSTNNAIASDAFKELVDLVSGIEVFVPLSHILCSPAEKIAKHPLASPEKKLE